VVSQGGRTGIRRGPVQFGMMYYAGQGVPQDSAEAVKWYRKAAEQGLPSAQFNLGLMYDKRQGVPQNFVEAVNGIAWRQSREMRRPVQPRHDVLRGPGRAEGLCCSAHVVSSCNLAIPRIGESERERAEVSRDIAASRLTPAQIAERNVWRVSGNEDGAVKTGGGANFSDRSELRVAVPAGFEPAFSAVRGRL